MSTPRLDAVDGVAFFNKCFESYRRVKCSSSDDSKARLEFLTWFRSRLMRGRCYRRLLSVVDRRLLELTIGLGRRGLVKIVSGALLNALGGVLSRAFWFAKRFADLLAELGEPILLDVCRVAASWGVVDAAGWLYDRGFAAYLALLKRGTAGFLTGAAVCGV